VRLPELPITDRDQFGVKADLKNLCLVCKEMQDVATPVLYKDMVVNVDKLNDDFQQVIKTAKDHRGLPHVRTLRVTRDPMIDPPSFARFRVVSQLLSAMPRDTLPTSSEYGGRGVHDACSLTPQPLDFRNAH